MADSERANHGGILTLAKAEGKRQKAKISAAIAGPDRNNCDLRSQVGLILALFILSAQGMPVATGGRYGKPFDIRERAFVSAATSVGAHLEEANAAASRAHFITLNRGALGEAREAKYWIRLIAATKLVGWESAPSLISEAAEPVAILTTIVKRASLKKCSLEATARP